jgi:hypothetical protein
MQTTIKRSLVLGFVLVALSLGLVSFSEPKGGDHFEIWLNNKMVIQQFLHGDKQLKTLVLQESNYNDNLVIKYSHCGKTGRDRSITLKDAQDRVVKSWTYSNATGSNMAMSCPVKEIMDLQKTKGNLTLRLFYTSAELPNGYLLVAVAKTTTAVASR